MNAMQEIRQGESQTREFKFRVDSQRKIAKTLVAFANTDGGTIFIGVKDNGVVAGVRGEEELYMMEGAADLHTRPRVNFRAEAIEVDGKMVLAIHVPKSSTPPHEAHEEDADGRASGRPISGKVRRISGRTGCSWSTGGRSKWPNHSLRWINWF